jgi:hypothetical protein
LAETFNIVRQSDEPAEPWSSAGQRLGTVFPIAKVPSSLKYQSLRKSFPVFREPRPTNGLLDSFLNPWWTEIGFLIEAHPWIMEDRENRSQ